ncbi:ribonuclease HI family protein [Laspinema olomoucense]|uniref:Ribonuclease HI family protein n=2 Tax=Laspinema TaxID=2584823 RepID=A0ABT2N8U7_9CYAN|nr:MULTISPECIES: ribonuclease HI family protein [unclassified Laspinema]MCT7971627.1 ribonuclease HI family protein [Laspinema sp. D3d]MCT7979120.1 ribonuclease HI family protein [Laspinema sp. D3b]MCT7987865.1 ribonuclease HI family protein [Laspinema sp. D3a]MCT7992878.1 ribonuclease HI family protein [Laspinema sp. D3c]
MYITIYSDGASRRNPGPAGAGAVLLDEQGNILNKVCKYLGETTNNQAEYQAAILGLKTALEMGATRVQLRADSELMVKQLLGQYQVKKPELKPLYDQVKSLLNQFESYAPPQHVRRADNALADAEANRAIDEYQA